MLVDYDVPTQEASSGVILNSAFLSLSCGMAIAEKPIVMPVFIVPIFAMNAAITYKH